MRHQVAVPAAVYCTSVCSLLVLFSLLEQVYLSLKQKYLVTVLVGLMQLQRTSVAGSVCCSCLKTVKVCEEG